MNVVNILGFALLPAAATAVAGAAAVVRAPSPSVRSAIEHFAAGVVFAVAAVELLPDVVRSHSPLGVALSFAGGVGFMLGLGGVTRSLERSTPAEADSSAGFLAAVGIDILIDGLLLGVGFAVATSVGRLLALAMSLEAISLGAAMSTMLRSSGSSRPRTVAITGSFGLLFVAGALAGSTVLHGVSRHTLALVLSFGLAALLYLVTEELLTEAHEVPETPVATAMFFAGFLVFLVLGMVA